MANLGSLQLLNSDVNQLAVMAGQKIVWIGANYEGSDYGT